MDWWRRDGCLSKSGCVGKGEGEIDGQSSIQYVEAGQSRTALSGTYIDVPKALRKREAERQKPSTP